MFDSKNPYYQIDDIARLAKAFVEAQLKVLANTSGDINGDAQKLKEWFDAFFRNSVYKQPEIDWSPYILPDGSPRCEYANHTRIDGNDHGPAVQSRGGYHICQKCYDAIRAAEQSEIEAYKSHEAK